MGHFPTSRRLKPAEKSPLEVKWPASAAAEGLSKGHASEGTHDDEEHLLYREAPPLFLVFGVGQPMA